MVTITQAEIDPRENLGMDIEMVDGDIVIGSNNDFGVVRYEKNLGQAIKHRLLTVIGELIRNPNYGSELLLFLGMERTQEIIPQVNSVVYRTLMQEPRVKEVIEIKTWFDEIDRTKLHIDLSVLPIDFIEPLNLVYELFV